MSAISEILKHNKARSLFGRKLQQSWGSMWILEKMLSNYKPDKIVELGTGSGTLMVYFSAYVLLNDIQDGYITIDIKEPEIKVEGAKFQKMDIYDKNTVSTLSDFLNTAERPFILVDGKDPKSTEVNLYAPSLKKGTVMFAHDAIIRPDKSFKWGFTEDKIDWNIVERYEPYYGWAKELDARMLCVVKK